jgi:protein-disulfide isomerase
MKRRLFFPAVLAAILSSFVVGIVNAQSNNGECGIETHDEAALTPGTLFALEGVEFDETSLSMSLQQALFDARLKHYKEQLKIIDSAILDIELEKRALSSGKSRENLTQELFAVSPPDENVIASFYRENKAQIPYPLEQVRDQIRQMLMRQQIQTKQQSLVADAKGKYNFQLTLEKPIAPYAEISTDGFPSKGPADAKLTLIEFADYQCPHCQKAAGVLRKIADRFADDLQIVFMDFPVNSSGISRTVAQGAACADLQGKFWPYHDLAFERQAQLRPDSANQLAGELQLDMESFQTCLKSNFPLERIDRSENEARRLGLSGTPTFFLNGRRLHMHDIDADLVDEITNELNGEKKS